jgi:GTPase
LTRSGFVALAGRPNVGKSTLVNAIVGDKVAIVSDRPQTTRRPIRGILSRGDVQIVLVDLPGVQRPRDALTSRMAGRVRQEVEDADGALFVLNGEQGVGPGDRFIAATLADAEIAVTIAVNKIDRLSRAATVAVLQQAADLDICDDVFPISARTCTGVAELVEHLGGRLPEGPFMFDERDTSDQRLELRLSELVREAAIKRTFQEVPHSLEAVVEEVDLERADFARVRALLWVETASQKGILIGAAGKMIKSIGTAARRELERELGCKVHLDLSVRVRRDWRADDGLLDRLGIT